MTTRESKYVVIAADLAAKIRHGAYAPGSALPSQRDLAGEFGVEHDLVASTVSVTTLLSVVTLLAWLYVLQ